MRFIHGLSLVALTVVLAGCEGFFGKKDKVLLVGKRETVLIDESLLKAEVPEEAQKISVAEGMENASWPVASGTSSHAMEPVALGSKLEKAWEISIGRGSGSESRLLNGPVSAEGKVFTLDARSVLSAVDLKTGQLVWEQDTLGNTTSYQSFSGGVSYDQGKLYVATSAAEVLALEAATGKILWRTKIMAPVRSAPSVQDGRIFVVTINNRLEALEEKTGKILWNHTGIIESAGLLGSAVPAIQGGVIVVPYSSGETFALRVENGFPLWSESLSSFDRLDSVSSLAHIKARPVIDQGRVFLISHSGQTSALDLRSGKVLWNRTFGGIRSPALTGDYLFMVTQENNLLCLTKSEGKIVWTVRLPRFEDEAKREKKILWAGPILAKGQLVLSSSHGQVIFVSARDGKISQTLEVGEPIHLSPIVAQKTLILLTDNGNLIAYR